MWREIEREKWERSESWKGSWIGVLGTKIGFRARVTNESDQWSLSRSLSRGMYRSSQKNQEKCSMREWHAKVTICHFRMVICHFRAPPDCYSTMCHSRGYSRWTYFDHNFFILAPFSFPKEPLDSYLNSPSNETVYSRIWLKILFFIFKYKLWNTIKLRLWQSSPPY